MKKIIASTSQVSNSMEVFLEDLAQIYGLFTYGQIINFEKTATTDEIEALKKLRRSYLRIADTDEAKGEAIAAQVRDIIYSGSQPRRSYASIVRAGIKQATGLVPDFRFERVDHVRLDYLCQSMGIERTETASWEYLVDLDKLEPLLEKFTEVCNKYKDLGYIQDFSAYDPTGNSYARARWSIYCNKG